MKRVGAAAKSGAVILACLGMLLPSWSLQAAGRDVGSRQDDSTSARDAAVIDVALDDGGTLSGQVVDAQGKPVVRTSVAISQLDREVASAVTDRSGHFRVSGLRGGMYRLATGKTMRVYRFWAPGTAPPSVRCGTLVVPNEEQVLGQDQKGFFQFLRNPWFVGAVVAAAIVLPIVLHDSDPKS
jgi:hypothetical protein